MIRAFSTLRAVIRREHVRDEYGSLRCYLYGHRLDVNWYCRRPGCAAGRRDGNG